MHAGLAAAPREQRLNPHGLDRIQTHGQEGFVRTVTPGSWRRMCTGWGREKRGDTTGGIRPAESQRDVPLAVRIRSNKESRTTELAQGRSSGQISPKNIVETGVNPTFILVGMPTQIRCDQAITPRIDTSDVCKPWPGRPQLVESRGWRGARLINKVSHAPPTICICVVFCKSGCLSRCGSTRIFE